MGILPQLFMNTPLALQNMKKRLQTVRNVLRYNQDPLEYMTEWQRTYGNVSVATIGKITIYSFFSPEGVRAILVDHARSFSNRENNTGLLPLLGDGLLVIDGDFHKQQRRLLLPAFHRKRIESYRDIMVAYTQRLLDNWKPGQQVDMLHEMQQLTLSVAAKTLFNVEVNEQADELGQAFTTALKYANEYWRWWNIPPLRVNLPFTPYGRFCRARALLNQTVYSIIAERRAHQEDTGDIVFMLLAARDEDGLSLTDTQVRDEAVTLLLAGHETTANLLTWTLYLLSRYVAVRERLLDELYTVLAGRAPTIEDLARLPYLEMVIDESLRLYPPAWALARTAMEDVEIDGTRIPAGSYVFLSQWVMHRMPEYFPDPETFMPERFDPQHGNQHPQYAYFPFGGGPRLCLGMTFAYMEARLVLATMLQRFTPMLVGGFPVVPSPLITLRPKYGMQMRIEKTPEPITMGR